MLNESDLKPSFFFFIPFSGKPCLFHYRILEIKSVSILMSPVNVDGGVFRANYHEKLQACFDFGGTVPRVFSVNLKLFVVFELICERPLLLFLSITQHSWYCYLVDSELMIS